MNELLYFIAAASIAATLTQITRLLALRLGILDVPNARSSHSTPTPRGGGLAIVVTTIAGTAALTWAGRLELSTALVLVVAGSMVAAVGYIDDRIGLSPLLRFSVHMLSAVLGVLIILTASGHAPLTGGIVALAWAIMWCLIVSWSINLFNFMDGIDGLAGSQAVFVMGSSALLATTDADSDLAVFPLLTAGACLGFLVWNWPRAKIFMGDVGSGFLGFWLASTALVLATLGALNPWASLVLNAIFVADATATLLRRVFAGKRWYEAHRSHAYQHLARRWQSHRRVTVLLWKINTAIVLPLAFAAAKQPKAAPAIAIGTVVTCGLLALMSGAGKDSATA